MKPDKIDSFLNELQALFLKYNVSLGVDIDGDTHGIYENFIVIDGNKEHIINEGSSYLDAYDIKEQLSQ